MEVFEKNRRVLEEKYPEIVEKISEIKIDKLQKRIAVGMAKDGEAVLRLKCGEAVWNLNSRISPQQAANIYAERYESRVYKVFFVFGFSDGRHVRRLLQNCDETNRMVICVPDLEVFFAAIQCFDVADVLLDKRVYLYFLDGKIGIAEILEHVVEYSNMKLLEFCILPGYDVLYTKACSDFIDNIMDKIQHELVHKGTRLGFDRMIPRHMLFHMKNMIYQRNMEQLRLALEEYDLEKVPAIIVSAGPSLDKNVTELRKAQGKAFIMVVDAALQTVLRAGVRPDIVCTIDPESPDRFFENLDLTEIVWLCGRLTRPCVVEKYGKKVFYEGGFTEAWKSELSKELGYAFPELPVGGSVTAQAFAAAQYLGFKKLILVGQDMAFTDGISHTSGIDGAFGDNDAYIQSRLRMQVEGIDGTMLETDFQMWSYKKWFEKYIKRYNEQLSVIDATEGGARIAGTEIRALQETVQTECRYELDLYAVVQSIPPVFTNEQQNRLKEKLYALSTEANVFRGWIEKLIDRQKKILQLMNQKEVTQSACLKELKCVMEQNEKVAQDGNLDLLIYYAQEEEYEIGDTIYMEKDMTLEQIVEKNVYLYKGYVKAVGLLQEDIKEYIMNA